MVDVKGGQALTVMRTGQMRRYSYPDFKLTGTYRLDQYIHRIALDSATRTLYAVRVSGVFIGPDGRTRGNDPELLVYDVGKLRPNKGFREAPSLAARARFKLDGAVGQMALAPDGKYLYYLDVTGNKLCRVDLVQRKVDRSVDVEATPAALGLTPDGKTLWVGSYQGDRQGKLHRLTAPNLEAKGTQAVDLSPREVAATDSGMLAVSGTQGTQHIARLVDADNGFRERFQRRTREVLSVALSADQKVVFVSPHVLPPVVFRRWPTTREGGAEALPMLKLEGKGRLKGGELIATPDGEFLLLPGAGMAVRLTGK